VKLWFDEDLSPTLVQVANDLGFEATCNRDRGLLGTKDPDLRPLVQAEGYVFATDNASDFRPMYAREEIHPGLLALPAGDSRTHQQQLLRAAIDFISTSAAVSGEQAADFMINKLVEVDETGSCIASDLPPP
jgi:predicted nuclease of predicted toxin-antitoxin system